MSKHHKHFHPHHHNEIELAEQREHEHIEDSLPESDSPLKYIISVFVVLLLIAGIFPFYSVKMDPSPSSVPSREEILLLVPAYDGSNNVNISFNSRDDYRKFVSPYDPVIKRIALNIVSSSCESGKRVCHAKALYEFVKNEIKYVSDPINKEYLETGHDLILNGGGDCESGTLFLASLMETIGINAELVFIPGHVFLRIMLPEARNAYKLDGDWVYLDWTCNNCEFGELPWQNIKKEASYLDVP